MTPPHLRGGRILLRPLIAADRPAIARILAEPGVSRWWGPGGPDVAVRELFEEAAAGVTEVMVFAIEAGGEVAGFIQASEEADPDYRHAGIDLALGTAWQGRGIGPEAIRLVARYLFEERGHHRLTIDPAASNDRAIRAYEKVGFRRVGVMRRYERGSDGAWHDGLLMDMLREDLRGKRLDPTG